MTQHGSGFFLNSLGFITLTIILFSSTLVFSIQPTTNALNESIDVSGLFDLSNLEDGSMSSGSKNLTHVIEFELCKSEPELAPFSDPIYLNQSFKGWNAQQLESESDFASLNELVTSGVPEDPQWPETDHRNLVTGTYSVHAWVRLDGEGDSTHPVHMGIRAPGRSVKDSKIVATGSVRSSCWTKLEGGFNIYSEGDNITLHLGGVPGDRRLLLSNFALSTINPKQWKVRQDKQINKLRKGNVLLRVRLSNNKAAAGATVQIKQVNQAFPFGAAVTSAISRVPAYRKWFLNRFNFATFQNELKWYVNEPTKGKLNFRDADVITNALRSLRIPLRGHCVFWDPEENIQSWVKRESQRSLKKVVSKRVRDVVRRYKGRFAHWDVVNEALHGPYLDMRLKDRHFVASMFRLVDQVDPRVQKFLNDYNIVEYYYDSLSSSSKVIEQVRNIRAAGARVDRLGVQGHFGEAIPTRIKAELDILGRAGIPVWLTEFDMIRESAADAAAHFEAVMREVFAHPNVGGIIQWEVARLPCKQLNSSVYRYACAKPCPKCLTSPSLKDNAIGRRYLALLKEWSTSMTKKLSKGGSVKFRGFHGKYRAIISFKGKKYTRYFNFPKGSNAMTATIKI